MHSNLIPFRISSIIAPIDQEKGNAYDALEASLEKLDCEYIDLYLIHWPGIFGSNATLAENRKRRNESWKEMVKGVKKGLVRNIGVSNYNVRHLKELLANDHGIKPAVNQVRQTFEKSLKHLFNCTQDFINVRLITAHISSI